MTEVIIKIVIKLVTKLLTEVFISRLIVKLLAAIADKTSNTLDDKIVRDVAEGLGVEIE